jgi:hypothetical protein
VISVVWNLVLVCLETMLASVQDRWMVCAEHTIGMKSFWSHFVRLLDDEAQVEARIGLFVDSTSLMQDWCMVCVERTVGSKIVLKAPDGSPS